MNPRWKRSGAAAPDREDRGRRRRRGGAGRGAGAAARFGQEVGLALCGGNIDTRLLANVLLRDLAGRAGWRACGSRLQDRPGALFQGDAPVRRAQRQHHRDLSPAHLHHLPAKGLITDIECEARDAEQVERLVEGLRAKGYTVQLVELG
jgi:threonine dehydratase